MDFTLDYCYVIVILLSMFSSVRYLSNVSSRLPATFDIAIVGGGTAGMNLAWKMGRYHKKLNIALIEPSSVS